MCVPGEVHRYLSQSVDFLCCAHILTQLAVLLAGFQVWHLACLSSAAVAVMLFHNMMAIVLFAVCCHLHHVSGPPQQLDSTAAGLQVLHRV